MLELDGDLRAVDMTGRGHLAEAFDGGIREQARLAGAALRLLIDDGRLDRDEAEAALGSCFIVGKGAVGQRAVRVRGIISHRGHDEAVGNRHRTDLHGRKHGRKFHLTRLLF